MYVVCFVAADARKLITLARASQYTAYNMNVESAINLMCLRVCRTRFFAVVMLLLFAGSALANDGGIRHVTELRIQGGGSINLSRGVRGFPSPAMMPLPYGPNKLPTALRISRITFYQAVREQTDDTPNIAACGRNIGPWIQIAVSRDLLQYFPCRSLVRIELDRPIAGIEWFDAIVYDTMNPRFRNTVDVLVGVREPANSYGVTTGTLYYVTR